VKDLIDALREATVMANVPTLPVPLGPPMPRYPLTLRPERAKKPKAKANPRKEKRR
jgi:hypothetical protein